jgi:tetratricopeptide (TPR) repeat protein
MPWLAALLFLVQADPTAEGLKALDEGRYDAAAAAFQKATASDPRDYFAHFNLAMSYTLLHRDPEAVAEYRKTLEIKPGLYEAELNGGIVLMRQNNPVDAGPLLEDAARQKPGEFRPRYYFAESLLQTGDYARAEENYRQAIALDPKSAPAQLGMAQVLVQQGQLPDAARYFREAARIDPTHYRSYLLELAQLYEKAGQNADAVAIYREFPENPQAQARVGELLLESRKFADAVPKLEESYQKTPDSRNRVALASAYVFTQQLDKALPLLDQAVSAEPGDYDVRMMYARALRDRKQYAPAARQFYEAARIRPAEPKPWTELGGMLYMTGDYVQALTAFENARKAGENSAGNWFLQAIILDKLKQLKPAKQAYEQFLALSNGQNPNQEFQARQRVRILDREINKK